MTTESQIDTAPETADSLQRKMEFAFEHWRELSEDSSVTREDLAAAGAEYDRLSQAYYKAAESEPSTLRAERDAAQAQADALRKERDEFEQLYADTKGAKDEQYIKAVGELTDALVQIDALRQRVAELETALRQVSATKLLSTIKPAWEQCISIADTTLAATPQRAEPGHAQAT